jgi:hypothetical protein
MKGWFAVNLDVSCNIQAVQNLTQSRKDREGISVSEGCFVIGWGFV